MLSLLDIGRRYGTDKVSHGFLPHYENYTKQFRYDNVNVMEIGVFHGASIKMWHEYFPNGIIYAADWWQGLNGNKHTFANPRLFIDESSKYTRSRIVNLNQHEISELNDVRKELHDIQFDWILDDGSHLSQDQQQTLGYLWTLVKPGGYYVIEDIHCSLGGGYDVLPDGSNSTLTMLHNFNKTGEIASQYMTPEQQTQIQSEIDGKIDLGLINYKSDYEFASGTAIIKKKLITALL